MSTDIVIHAKNNYFASADLSNQPWLLEYIKENFEERVNDYFYVTNRRHIEELSNLLLLCLQKEFYSCGFVHSHFPKYYEIDRNDLYTSLFSLRTALVEVLSLLISDSEEFEATIY